MQHSLQLAKAWLSCLLNVRGRSQRTFDGYGVVLRKYVASCGENRMDPLYSTLEDSRPSRSA